MDHDKRLIEATGEGRIEGVGWGEVRPYVMFITGRCGSTWLTELLAATRLAGEPQEWLNSDVAKYSGALGESLPEYFSNVVEKSSAGGRFGIQVDPERLADTLHLVDWRGVFPAVSTPTFFLYRRDLVEQAWSWVHARKSGIWHSSDLERTAPRPDTDPSPTLRELADQVVALRRWEESLGAFWAEHGYEPRFIAYEDLVADPAGTVAGILRDLGVPADEVEVEVGAKSKPLAYDDSKAAVLGMFRGINAGVLGALERDRFGVAADDLAERLLGVEPIVPHLVGADSLAE